MSETLLIRSSIVLFKLLSPVLLLLAAPALAQPLNDFLRSAERANFDARTGVQARAQAQAEFATA